MGLSTFKVSITGTQNSDTFKASAREFEINFSSKAQKDAVTPEEGIVTAIGTCENIVTAGVYDKHHLNYDAYQVLSHFTSSQQVEVKFDLKKHRDLLPEVKQAIKDTSPVYHNLTNSIPITTKIVK